MRVAFAPKTRAVKAVIREIVPTRIGARTENAPRKRGLEHCYECSEDCKKGLLGKIKPYAFSLVAKEYGEQYLLDCLQKNERNGVIYHREGISGDYDDFDDVEKLVSFIKTGKR